MTTKAELKQQAKEYADGWGIDPTKKPRAAKGKSEFEDASIESGLEDGGDPSLPDQATEQGQDANHANTRNANDVPDVANAEAKPGLAAKTADISAADAKRTDNLDEVAKTDKKAG